MAFEVLRGEVSNVPIPVALPEQIRWQNIEFEIDGVVVRTPRTSHYTPKVSNGDEVTAIVDKTEKSKAILYALRNDSTKTDFPGPGWHLWFGLALSLIGVVTVVGLFIVVPVFGIPLGTLALILGILHAVPGKKHAEANKILSQEPALQRT